MKSSEFSEKIYAKLRKVPKGLVTTYGDLALAINSKAFRAVGQAMRNNPNAPEVACHRVVMSNGLIGGFSGKKSGTAIKKKISMLQKEGVLVRDNRVVDFERIRFSF